MNVKHYGKKKITQKEQKKNFLNKQIIVQKSGINETNEKFVKSVCEDTGNKKIWKRNCPKCNELQTYSNKYKLLRAIKTNSSCVKCNCKTLKIKNRKYFNSYLEKECPNCKKVIKFSTIYKYNRSIKNNSVCFSCSKKGNKNPMFGIIGEDNPSYNISRSLSQKIKHSLFMKKHLKNSPKIFTDATRDKMRLSRLKWLKKNGKIIKPFYNKNACLFMDSLTEYKFQHALNGGEFCVEKYGYYVDGYDKEKNIIFEYDEPHHFDVYGNLKEKDIKRMKKIQEEVKCDFLRYNEPNKKLICHKF